MNLWLVLLLVLIFIAGFVGGMVITAMRVVYVIMRDGSIYIGQGWHMLLVRRWGDECHE